MKHRHAATAYAKALFAAAKEWSQTEVVSRELDELGVTFESNPELREAFARPWIPRAARRALATELARRSDLSKLTTNFLALLGERRRTDYLKAISQKYQKLLDEDLGRVRARVRTAVPLTDFQRQILSAKLAQVLGARQVVLEEVVDRAMLGGFVIESGSVVLDASLEGELDRMRRLMSRELPAITRDDRRGSAGGRG